MPINIILEIDKSHFKKQISTENQNTLSIKLEIPVEIHFEEKELETLMNFIENNKKFEYLKINLPGSFSFNELITDELIKEEVPNLKITISEKINNTISTSFNEFH